jgi:hypothetical protein
MPRSVIAVPFTLECARLAGDLHGSVPFRLELKSRALQQCGYLSNSLQRACASARVLAFFAFSFFDLQCKALDRGLLTSFVSCAVMFSSLFSLLAHTAGKGSHTSFPLKAYSRFAKCK